MFSSNIPMQKHFNASALSILSITVYIEDITCTWPSGDTTDISSVEKYFTSEHSERVKYFSTLEEKFSISKRPCNFLFII